MAEYSAGDRIVIRDWDDMAEEYGYHGSAIDCRMYFTGAMRCLCGREFTIVEVHDDNKTVELDPDAVFTISFDMIRHVDDVSDTIVDVVSDDFLDVLFEV